VLFRVGMRIETDLKLDFKDVLLRPKRSTLATRQEVDLNRQYSFLHSQNKWHGVPIIAANMDHTGTFAMAKVLAKHQMLTAINKFAGVEEFSKKLAKDKKLTDHVFITAGTSDEDFLRLTKVLKKIPDLKICLDVANGYQQRFVEFVKKVRHHFRNQIIMAGNVVTGEMTEELLLSGADIVKVGIGPGSVCTTRVKTGVGYPQLSAIIECADAAHGVRGLVCADGGCTVPGDVAKAFAAGADFVMLGGMLAGHDECSGEIFAENGKKFKRFYGMSSSEAMVKYHGKVAKYRASEGRSVKIPYRGPVENTILDTLGGVRSTCTYIGARRLKELSKCATFIRVSEQFNQVFSQWEINDLQELERIE
jgi:GMP reductase